MCRASKAGHPRVAQTRAATGSHRPQPEQLECVVSCLETGAVTWGQLRGHDQGRTKPTVRGNRDGAAAGAGPGDEPGARKGARGPRPEPGRRGQTEDTGGVLRRPRRQQARGLGRGAREPRVTLGWEAAGSVFPSGLRLGGRAQGAGTPGTLAPRSSAVSPTALRPCCSLRAVQTAALRC